MDLKIKISRVSPEAWVIFLRGSIDSLTDFEFRKEIFGSLDKGAKHLLLQMQEVKYISSSGLSVLLELQKKVGTQGGFWGLYEPQLAVQRVLQIIKLENWEVKLENLDPANPFYDYVSKREMEKAQTRAQKPTEKK